MKRKWKILLACVVVVAAVAAMTVGIGTDRSGYFRRHQGTGAGRGKRGYRVGCSPWLSESSVEINGRDSEGLWHIYLDEDTAVIYDGDRRYPLINGEELLEQLWALLPEQ